MQEFLLENIAGFSESIFATHLLYPMILLFITYNIVNKGIEKFKHKNAKELQVDSFYREQNSNHLNNLLNQWSTILFDTEKVKDESFKQTFNELLSETYLYGDNKSVKLLSSFQQYNYKNEDNEIVYDNLDKRTLKVMMYVALIMTTLKEQYTNYKIEPEEVLKMKLKFYDDVKNLFQEYKQEIKKNINY
ncbi:hypothetical protein [Staphylococcus pseudintermedius]|uniref:hypothetical protein n=1 Tax=Staphylococcus pseudintermedius TaxID=283734 RepID=UPI0018F3E0EC|nr:hypothetical protein [Staphylococcus pseudintermedius]EGQ3411846.1 hypothetical protein [Staphylococcus pseudintermedius]EGQ3560716.1 hypothetical protein [Staphylococcus pseudintermedius]EHC9970515.1 hypothetical protein [Staphylococcus pseudintermedius]EIE3865929.1 hypothetical protein [Staphylococcus pseudintermedius]EIT1243477.1 hypothetical protein [Staphylococcus pseudintermedius]